MVEKATNGRQIKKGEGDVELLMLICNDSAVTWCIINI